MKEKSVELQNIKTKRSFWKRIIFFFRNFILLFFLISIGWVVICRFVPVFITPLMLIRSVESIAKGEAPKNSKKWVSIDEISPNMVQAVMASEDDLFMTHHGFSFEAISKAFEHNQKGKRIRGGSTISQQTAKNVFLFPQRSYVRKAFEAYFTVLIELIWGKQRIMEVYLNVIEMGKGIYGVEAASEEHFGVKASQLTKNQAALIAATLPNPRRFDAGHPTGYIVNRKIHIINVMSKIAQTNFEKQVQPTKEIRKPRRK
jgi:monofunctional glycosyltransferase